MIEIRGTRLHIAGLNSAWMSCGDEDPDHLLLGRYQLTQTVETAQAEDVDWRIAVVHHPWAYLAEFDQHKARLAVHQHSDLLLRGHLHQQLSECVLPPDPSRACLELAAGCIYANSQYPNAFQWIELSPADKHVRVHFRAWSDNAWIIDRNRPGCLNGHADFELSATLSPRSEPKPGRLYGENPKLPPHYLERTKDLDAIKSMLLEANSPGVSLARRGVAIQGMSGVGKTILAAAVIEDPEIRAAFPSVSLKGDIDRGVSSGSRSVRLPISSRFSGGC